LFILFEFLSTTKLNLNNNRISSINISLIYHRQHRKLRNYHTQSFVLCDVDQASKNVGANEIILKSRRGGFIHWTGSLKPGFYVLIPFSTSFWKEHINEEEQITRDFTLVIHSSIQLNGTLIDEPPTLLADCLIAATIKYCDKPEKVCRNMFIYCLYFLNFAIVFSSIIRIDIQHFMQHHVVSMQNCLLRKICR
jgi:hypothetical protein